MLAVGGVVLALLCALIVHKKKASKLQREHNSKIRRVLEVVTDNETAISSLRALSEFYPDDVAKDLQQIEALWFKLGEQLKEFTGHPVKSTIQSSVLTTRAMKVADRICELVDSVNERLE
jgi:hypothetical protein